VTKKLHEKRICQHDFGDYYFNPLFVIYFRFWLSTQGIVNHVEFLLFIYLKYKAKKSKTYRKLTMPNAIGGAIHLILRPTSCGKTHSVIHCSDITPSEFY
jgi:hypothetical protein